MTFDTPLAPVVVDASVALDGLLGEAGAVAAWDRWADEGRTLLAPPIAWPEIGQALLRRRLSPEEMAGHLDVVVAAGLETADRGPYGVALALGLAVRHGLSAYDATYLWLAIDIDGELATRDAALARAAIAEGVPLALEP